MQSCISRLFILYESCCLFVGADSLQNKNASEPYRASDAFYFNGFTQCHACVVQTTTRYAGVHKKLYKKITNRITIRMFKSIVKKKGDFNGK